MTTITVGFSKSKSPWKIGSKVIQAVEKRNFSHVYIKYQCSITGKLIVAQASHGFVHELTWDNFLEHNMPVKEYTILATDEGFKNAIVFIRNNLGVKYSYSQLFWIGVKKLLRMEVNVNNKDSAYICSEFGVRICGLVGVGISVIYNLDTYTPSNLNELLIKFKDEHPNNVWESYG